ncbi:hypothetical protein BDP27DRAFT_640182 [Rhodocollybia butyracea]|uniref:Uncharacterized protein n=1 Tax=Rhodocollybia butyracea TaxID=206335 RepID=A0A9P5P4D1_9AGAR|nr:hypothetical protein BDP27DRAFT_640182 [Rhodocollybia butyracea]
MQTQKQQPQLEASLEECTNLQRSRTRQYSYDGTAYSPSGSRRHQRYSQQEQALSTSFQTHVSTEHLSISPETQLRFLHQATSFLAIQAAESRQRSETLVSKGSENINLERDREARVQRWKEERRFERIQDEVRRLEAVIANEGTDIQETRFEKNLVRFLQTSTCRVRARPRSSSTYNVELDHCCRRMTLADVSPMRTRSWSVTAAFMESLRIRQPKHRKPLVSSLQSTPEDNPFSKPRYPPIVSPMSTYAELYSGTAIIFSNDETQFNPDVQNIIVEMPDYAKDLFSGFDSVALALELELDERPLESSLISTKNPSPFSQSPPSSTNHSRYSSVPASPSPSPSHPRSRPASSPSSLRIRDRFSALN